MDKGFLFLILAFDKIVIMRNVNEHWELLIKDFNKGLLAKRNFSLEDCTFQQLDFTRHDIDWKSLKIKNTTFLGCQLKSEDEIYLIQNGAFIYKSPDGLPYNPFRKDLYNFEELMEGYSFEKDDSTDIKIYNHFSKTRNNPGINEALYQRIHDHAVDEALRNLIEIDDEGMTNKKCIGIMGGHSTQRTDPYYVKVAKTAKLLTENDYFIASGGGPGIMEAANLGAYFAGRTNADLKDALAILQKAPHYTDKDFHRMSYEVLEKYPDGSESLAIPTWFYGHEPSNLFSTFIAKYFSNSIREDTLLAISLYGIVCAPGSAGTTQEIFMDAAQNHYCTFSYYSPMIFLGKQRYEIDTMIFPMLKQLAHGRPYSKMLHCTDKPKSVLKFLKRNPPQKGDG